MEHAGFAVAADIRTRMSKRPVTVLCGPGNNGGDGFVIARHLFNTGWPVRLALYGEVDRLKGSALLNAQRWQEGGGRIEPLTPDVLKGAGLLVDALFGAGLSKPLPQEVADLAQQALTADLPVVAVDMPSGVSGDTGAVLGEAAFQAHLTVTFFRKKPGHVLYPGRGLCGEVVCRDIGISDVVLGTLGIQTFENGPALWSLPDIAADGHKYHRGHVLVFASEAMSGAARLAAQAARASGAGLVTVAAPKSAWPLLAEDAPGLILIEPHDVPQAVAERKITAMVVGCGLPAGEETTRLVLQALDYETPLVLDAGALTSFSSAPETLFDAVRARKAPIVFTPHTGEFRHLFPGDSDKLTQGRAAARTSGAVVVLKGADSVITEPGGKAAINTNAPKSLATAGSGDVLAGIIAALAGQGMGGFDAASAGVWLHGEAGQHASVAKRGPITSESLLPALPQAVEKIRST